MITSVNPYKGLINSLDAVAMLSIVAGHAVKILRGHMVLDPAHDEQHIVRVVRNAMWFALFEKKVHDVQLRVRYGYA